MLGHFSLKRICILFTYILTIYAYIHNRLQVVSTRVGGVPEVLPPDLIRLVEPSAKGESHCSLYFLSPEFFIPN